MKRKNNLYQNICDIKNIEFCYNEVCRNTKNKNKVQRFKSFECINITNIYNTLVNKRYEPGKCNVFYIYEPKKRRIVSQNMFDKTVNHLVSRFILYPAILPCLVDGNCASRIGKGTKYALELSNKYYKNLSKTGKPFYILKCDIKSYFATINHERLKEKLKRKIKDKDSLDIIFKLIDFDDDGLSIGFMSSQILGIFYLNDFDHYIKEELHIKRYVRYQDDFLLFHQDKEYLKECLVKIKKYLSDEDLVLNQKTRIFKSTNNFIFLGRNKYGNYAKYRYINRKLKKRKYLYENEKIPLSSYVSSYICLNYYKKNLNQVIKENKNA